MKRILESISQAIAPERVISLPSKVFICGGPFTEAEEPTQFLSMRDYVCWHIRKNHPDFYKNIVFADNVNLWLQDSEYADLLELEEHLAGLVTVIPLFVESAGAYAELGSFVLMEHIFDKLLLFTEDSFRDQRSFIALGPIKRLENKYENRVLTHMWPKIGKPFDTSDVMLELASNIYSEIKNFCDNADSSNAFDSKIPAHIILLICDIIDLLHISQIGEIEAVLNGINGKYEISRRTIAKYLLIATKLEIVKKVENGHNKFYVSKNFPQEGLIKYSFPESKTKSRTAWKVKIADHITQYEPERKRIRDTWLERQKELDHA